MLGNWPAAQKGCASRSSELCWKTFPDTQGQLTVAAGWGTALTQSVLFHGVSRGAGEREDRIPPEWPQTQCWPALGAG